MKILWLSWKDAEHPHAGGAELLKSMICQRLSADGHVVIQLTGGFPGAAKETVLDGGCRVIRLGNRWTVYWHVWRYYNRHLRGWADLVIDECNTVPFFAGLYSHERVAMIVYQLSREIWFHQMSMPISLFGYFLEPIYLRILHKNRVVTICESSRQDLIRHGFSCNLIDIISVGIELEPLPTLESVDKFPEPTMLYLGSLRKMKRPDHVVKAFNEARQEISNLKLLIAGEGDGGYYYKNLMHEIAASPYVSDIKLLGRVTKDQKIQLMQKSHLIAVTSVKEGWGLIVTEAASQGTPAVVYDVDGLRDSVRDGQTGMVTKASPSFLAKGVVDILSNDIKYKKIQLQAWEWSREINFNNSYNDFKNVLGL